MGISRGPPLDLSLSAEYNLKKIFCPGMAVSFVGVWLPEGPDDRATVHHFLNHEEAATAGCTTSIWF